MAATPFDPTHAVRFDLAAGAVLAGADRERMVVLPCAALDELVLSAPGEAVDALARVLGGSIGKRAAARMRDVAGASVEAFVTQLAGEMALAGVGAMSVERWGRALVVVVESSPLQNALLVPLVASAIEAATGKRAACAALSRDDKAARLLVASDGAVGRVREWVAAGIGWGEALARLQGGGS
jgi:hypothetical protein